MIRGGELRALTGARGLAAWMVVLFHVRLSIGGITGPLGHYLAKGYLAVDFFFLLSGFVIRLSWGERFERGGWRLTGDFLRKRIARIWPLHAVTLAGTVAFALALLATGRRDPLAFPFAELPLHVLLLQNWGWIDRLAWNVPSWSISAELFAYILFPLVAIAIDWRRLSNLALIALAGALLVGICVTIGGSASLGFDVTRFGLVRCVAEFTTGSIVCLLWQRGSPTAGWAIGTAIFAGLWWAGLPETIAAPAVFAGLLFLLARFSGPRNPLASALPHWLGEISYATYLCHYPLWIAFKLLFVRDADAVPAMVIAAYLAIVLAASALLHRFVERPGQRWLAGRPADRALRTDPPVARLNRPLPPPALPQALRGSRR